MENALTQAGEAAAAEQAEDILESPAATETGAENDSPEEGEQKPPRTFTQEELDAKLAKQRNQRDRRHSREIAALKEQMDRLAKAQEERKSNTNDGEPPLVAPKRDDYATYEEYLEARTDYRTDLKNRERDEQLRKHQERERTERTTEATQKELVKMANDRVAEGRKEFPDFDQVMQDAFEDGTLVQDTELYFGIIESPAGHRIAHYLATHPEEAERIGKLSPRGVHREIGKLEDKFSKAPEKKKAASMETLHGSGRVIKPNDPMRNDVSMDDYVRLRNEQERKRRGY